MLRRLFLVGLCLFACKKHVEPDEGGVEDAGEEEAATTTSAVQIFVEPSDNAQVLVSSLQNAQSSIHMTMYLLTNNTVINTLIAKKKAGLDVKVVLNKNFPSSGTDNTNVFNNLQSNGVEVVWAPSLYVYTHEKAIIVDGASVWIMTMNVTFSSPTSNREYLALDTDPDDVAEAEVIFQADFTNSGASPTGKLLVAPINARAGILDLINNAQTKLDVEDEELSDSQVVPALVAAHDRGVAVRVVLSDDSPTTAMANAVATLEGAGIAVKKLATPYVHAKAIVADDTLAYVGSENLTQNSLDANRELGLIVSALSEVAKVETTIDSDFGAGVVY